jgi:tRNA(His) guanylyltransferase
MDKSSLGDRMKGYEAVYQGHMLRRTPTIIRVDGKAFHTFTKNFTDMDLTPFSDQMHKTMIGTARMMMRNIQGAQLAYTQSDEISILLRDWDSHETQQWFGGKKQKMISIAGSMATAYFNNTLRGVVSIPASVIPLFDARVFQLPFDDVTNYFIWRQQDATRNSVQMLGRHFFSHKQMHLKNVSNIQDMLMKEHQVNWNDIDTWKKRGACINPSLGQVTDEEIPIFTKDRAYIDDLLQVGGDDTDDK